MSEYKRGMLGLCRGMHSIDCHSISCLFFFYYLLYLLNHLSHFLSHQSFLSLVNLLSSSQSVWELLGRQPLANKSEYTLREMPTSIPVSVFHTVSSRLHAMPLSSIWGHVCSFYLAFNHHPHICFTSQTFLFNTQYTEADVHFSPSI